MSLSDGYLAGDDEPLAAVDLLKSLCSSLGVPDGQTLQEEVSRLKGGSDMLDRLSASQSAALESQQSYLQTLSMRLSALLGKADGCEIALTDDTSVVFTDLKTLESALSAVIADISARTEAAGIADDASPDHMAPPVSIGTLPVSHFSADLIYPLDCLVSRLYAILAFVVGAQPSQPSPAGLHCGAAAEAAVTAEAGDAAPLPQQGPQDPQGLQAEVDALKEALILVTRENNSLRQRHGASSAFLEQADTTIRSQQQDIVLLQDEIIRLSAEFSLVCSHSNALEGSVRALECTNASLDETASVAGESMQHMNQRLLELEERVAAYSAQRAAGAAALQEQLREAAAARDDALLAAVQLREEHCGEQAALHEALRAKEQELANVAYEKDSALDGLSRQGAQLAQDLEQERRDSRRMLAELDTYVAQIHRLQDECDRKDQDADERVAAARHSASDEAQRAAAQVATKVVTQVAVLREDVHTLREQLSSVRRTLDAPADCIITGPLAADIVQKVSAQIQHNRDGECRLASLQESLLGEELRARDLALQNAAVAQQLEAARAELASLTAVYGMTRGELTQALHEHALSVATAEYDGLTYAAVSACLCARVDSAESQRRRHDVEMVLLRETALQNDARCKELEACLETEAARRKDCLEAGELNASDLLSRLAALTAEHQELGETLCGVRGELAARDSALEALEEAAKEARRREETLGATVATLSTDNRKLVETAEQLQLRASDLEAALRASHQFLQSVVVAHKDDLDGLFAALEARARADPVVSVTEAFVAAVASIRRRLREAGAVLLQPAPVPAERSIDIGAITRDVTNFDRGMRSVETTMKTQGRNRLPSLGLGAGLGSGPRAGSGRDSGQTSASRSARGSGPVSSAGSPTTR